jgi:hypothetical protein
MTSGARFGYGRGRASLFPGHRRSKHWAHANVSESGSTAVLRSLNATSNGERRTRKCPGIPPDARCGSHRCRRRGTRRTESRRHRPRSSRTRSSQLLARRLGLDDGGGARREQPHLTREDGTVTAPTATNNGSPIQVILSTIRVIRHPTFVGLGQVGACWNCSREWADSIGAVVNSTYNRFEIP